MSKKKKYYGLSSAHTRKPAREYVDFDYIDQLSEEEKEWLNRFSREFYHNNLRADDATALHNTPELRRSCYSAENARNRCGFVKWGRVPFDMTDTMDTETDKDSEG